MHSGNNGRLIAIVVAASILIVLLLVAGVGAIVFAVFRIVDATPTHRCGLAIVQRDPSAIAMLGTPIVQRGLTAGSSNSENGTTNDKLTFGVAGPQGTATVEAVGEHSDLESRLTVRLGRGGESQVVYDGKLDCPELHVK